MTSSRRALSFLLFLSIATTAPSPHRALAQQQQPSALDLARARDLFKEARQLRSEGKIREALEKFKAADALGQTPITGYELAKTYEQLGQLVEAREACLRVGRLAVQPDESERSDEARKGAAALAEALGTRIPSIVVRPKLPAGSTPTLVIDGVKLPATMMADPLKVNPGAHTVIVSIEGVGEARATVDVKEGETREVPLTIEGAPPPPPPPPSASASASASGRRLPPPPPAPSAQHPDFLVTAGITLTAGGFAVGALTGLAAISKANTLKTTCPNNRCGPDAYDDLDSGKTMGTISTVSFAVAGVGVALLVYVALRGRSDVVERAAIHPTPGGVGGSF